MCRTGCAHDAKTSPAAQADPQVTAPPISPHHKANWQTLRRAIEAGHAGLVSCIDKATGKSVVAICAFGAADGSISVTPFAKLFDGDPYEELLPPE